MAQPHLDNALSQLPTLRLHSIVRMVWQRRKRPGLVEGINHRQQLRPQLSRGLAVSSQRVQPAVQPAANLLHLCRDGWLTQQLLRGQNLFNGVEPLLLVAVAVGAGRVHASSMRAELCASGRVAASSYMPAGC